MSIFVSSLVRVVVIGAAVASYVAAVPTLFPDDGGGANIGAGLIAFGALVVVSFGWAVVDGLHRGTSSTILVWAIVSVVISVAWLVIVAIIDADAGTSATEIVSQDLGSLPFTIGLMLAPAAVGAAIGSALRPTRVEGAA
jgi:hypothetical protein